MIPRGVESARHETTGQLSRRLHLEFAGGGQQEILLAGDFHFCVGHRCLADFPVGGRFVREMPNQDFKVYGTAVTFRGKALVPVHRLDIEVLFLDSPDQRVIQDVLDITG